MTHRDNVEVVDDKLRGICNVHLPFGGKIMLKSEDFHKILPVIGSGYKGYIVLSMMKWPALYDLCKRMG